MRVLKRNLDEGIFDVYRVYYTVHIYSISLILIPLFQTLQLKMVKENHEIYHFRSKTNLILRIIFVVANNLFYKELDNAMFKVSCFEKVIFHT